MAPAMDGDLTGPHSTDPHQTPLPSSLTNNEVPQAETQEIPPESLERLFVAYAERFPPPPDSLLHPDFSNTNLEYDARRRRLEIIKSRYGLDPLDVTSENIQWLKKLEELAVMADFLKREFTEIVFKGGLATLAKQAPAVPAETLEDIKQFYSFPGGPISEIISSWRSQLGGDTKVDPFFTKALDYYMGERVRNSWGKISSPYQLKDYISFQVHQSGRSEGSERTVTSTIDRPPIPATKQHPVPAPA